MSFRKLLIANDFSKEYFNFSTEQENRFWKLLLRMRSVRVNERLRNIKKRNFTFTKTFWMRGDGEASSLLSFSSFSGRRLRAFTTTTVSLRIEIMNRHLTLDWFCKPLNYLSAVGRYDSENIISPQFVQLFLSESWSQVVIGLRISVIFISVSPV